jgi:hypothetical protein
MLAITHTVDRSATVNNSCDIFVTRPRFAVRVSTILLIGAGTEKFASICSARFSALRAQPVGIDINLVLQHRTADACYFGNAGY